MPMLRTIEILPLPKGTDEYEAKRKHVLEEFASKIPSELRLNDGIFDNPPVNLIDIPRTCGILTQRELDITETATATSLARDIAQKKLSAVEVVTAFAKRAAIAHQLTTCLTDWFLDEALEDARRLDEHLERTGEVVGPLHGVPVSIKDHMAIAGRKAAYGCISSITRHDKDCMMVEILRRQGAVVYVKTAQPQGVMHLETDSYTGRCLNPYNIKLSCGGSSGGEAALIAMKGSVLGIGTDIGGSIRCPAALCGIYGFKVTSATLPQLDMLPASGFISEAQILGSTGPLCTSLDDVDLFMSAVLSTQPWLRDPKLVPIPWTGLSTPPTLTAPRPLKVGLMLDDGVIQPQPPVQRALRWASDRLTAAAAAARPSAPIELKPFHPHRTAHMISQIRKLYWPDAAQHLMDDLAAGGEPVFPLTEHITRDVKGSEPLDAAEIVANVAARDAFRCEFARHWGEQDCDVVVCPAFVGPACAHGTSFHWNYTAMWNFVDYPAVTVPTPIRVEARDRDNGYTRDGGYKGFGEADREVNRLWREGDFTGAPVTLQVVGRRHHDNQLVGALAVLREALDLK